MRKLAYLLAFACVVVAVVYFVLPGGDLPSFMPGYVPGATRIHKMRGFAAIVAAIVFLLIGLSERRRSV